MGILEDIQARYARKETVVDTLGRAITVRPLKSSEQIRIHEMTDSTKAEVTNMLLAAASVISVDDAVFPFAKTRGELTSVVDMLDEEGFSAVGKGLRLLNEKSDAPKNEKEFVEAAGKSPGMPS